MLDRQGCGDADGKKKEEMARMEAQKHNAAVDELEGVANRFNEQVSSEGGATSARLTHLWKGGTTMSSQELRHMARAKIRNGELPCSEHPKTWGGRGRGAPCSVCGTAVEAEQLEFEVEVVEGGCGRLRFCGSCPLPYRLARGSAGRPTLAQL